jgi:hypothetical protein
MDTHALDYHLRVIPGDFLYPWYLLLEPFRDFCLFKKFLDFAVGKKNGSL